MSAKGKHGGKREGAGRKPKAKEQELIEKLSPFESDALRVLGEAVQMGEPWAVKMFMEYRFGKPLQRTENTHSLEDGFQNLPEWMNES